MVGVGDQARDQVDEEVEGTAVTRLKEQASIWTGAPVTAWPMDSWQLWAIAGAVG